MQSEVKPEPNDVELLAESLRNVIGQFVRLVRSQANSPTNAHDETLAFIARSGPISIAELAALRGVKHQSMRLVTGRLASEGLIALLPDSQDRRGYRIHLTEKGKAENELAKQARTQWIANRLSAIADPDDLLTLKAATAILQRLVDAES